MNEARTLEKLHDEQVTIRENLHAHSLKDDHIQQKIMDTIDRIEKKLDERDEKLEEQGKKLDAQILSTKEMVEIYSSLTVTSKLALKLFGFAASLVAGFLAFKWIVANLLK